jgi:diguanylate cyclase (GGDEF)-like protein
MVLRVTTAASPAAASMASQRAGLTAPLEPAARERAQDAALAPLRSLIEGLLNAVVLVDGASLSVMAVNAPAAALLGVDVLTLRGQPVVDLAATPEDLAFWQQAALGVREGLDSQTWLRRADGVLVAVRRRITHLRLTGEKSVFMVVMHDRSAELQAETALADQVSQLTATLESTHDGILVTDLTGRVRNFNRRFAALWDVPESLLAQPDGSLVQKWMLQRVSEPAVYSRRLSAIETSAQASSTDVISITGGRVLERVSRPQLSRGQTIGRVYSFRDISERIEADRRIDLLSHTDALTGLPNRRAMLGRIEHALALAQRDGMPFALLFLNLDRFKHINDTLGRGLGDRVLSDVAERLLSTLRQVDTVCRLGADEFVMLVHHADVAGAERSVQRLFEVMQRSFMLEELSFTVTCSVGIALYPGDGNSADELLQACDDAMHEAKEQGGNAFRFHQARDASASKLRNRMKLDHAMRQALVAGRFRLHYQPQVDVYSGEIVGAEALVRWRDPELGEVTPAELIPVAERSGFIVALGAWVLRQAVQQAALWRDKGYRLLISVNVSALQFQQPDFVQSVATALAECALEPQCLELELTESILIQDAQEAMQRLQCLSELGVKLAIDDFGTGYSSLAYLKRFPIGRLKIDRSFVKGLPGDESDAGIVRAIANMARALRLELIAEGVETEAQLQFMKQLGCQQFQGFIKSPALDVVSFESMMDAARPAAKLTASAPARVKAKPEA